ncbi:MAG TPA: hypothetical protein VJV03_12105 [Pyrinomonadaceae bacterium]|nr:hypothetical protein [Pyrinomonadaceae bacterium]
MILHIHNGDASADVAKQSSVPGEHFAWREALIDGPAPNNVNDDEWRRLRAQHLSEAYGDDQAEIERELRTQEQKLASFTNYDEVVLWFEHDLFCQVHLIYLLNWFAQRDLERTKLNLICAGSFPGRENFRGLGELSPEELSSLFPSRQTVTREQLDLAIRAWHAYRSTDPRDVESIVQSVTSALPFLDPALRAHLLRFPSTNNGLGRIENRGLQLVESGLNNFSDLFKRFGDLEPTYGLGDAQFRQSLHSLAEANQPLLLNVNGDGISREAAFEITDLGRAVLRGDGDFVILNGIERWLGGVHLSDERNLWRWDEKAEKIVQT